MKYVITHNQRGQDKSRRVAIVSSAREAIVMAAALAIDLAGDRTQATPGLADSVHVWGWHKGSLSFNAACFLCERDRKPDVAGAVASADRALAKWKEEGRKAKARHEWGKANFPAGKDITDFWQDAEFKAAFFSNDFTTAGNRLQAMLQPAEATA